MKLNQFILRVLYGGRDRNEAVSECDFVWIFLFSYVCMCEMNENESTNSYML